MLAKDSLRIVNIGNNKRYKTNESQIAILKFLCTNCEFNDICKDQIKWHLSMIQTTPPTRTFLLQICSRWHEYVQTKRKTAKKKWAHGYFVYVFIAGHFGGFATSSSIFQEIFMARKRRFLFVGYFSSLETLQTFYFILTTLK